MQKSLIQLPNGANQIVVIPATASSVADGVYSPKGIADVVKYSAQSVNDGQKATWDILDSIIPRTLYIEGSDINNNRKLDWRVYASRSQQLFRQVLKIGDLEELELGYSFNFPNLLAIEVPKEKSTSIQIQLEPNFNLRKFTAFCEPCVFNKNSQEATVRPDWYV